ncbi:hypothetical protein [Spirosoma linguale]|uniref:hypothetical protein n=1 Tax=Spirosoma linguale TaxID=108 RepID=UPI0026C7A527
MPVRQYFPGYAADYRLDELSATRLVFSGQRSGPDRYVESWPYPRLPVVSAQFCSDTQ